MYTFCGIEEPCERLQLADARVLERLIRPSVRRKWPVQIATCPLKPASLRLYDGAEVSSDRFRLLPRSFFC